jgi:L-fucose mutarotase
MLKYQLIHPQILSVLGKAGHSSKILISDGNYPHITKRNPNAEVVYLNFAPGVLGVVDVLKVLVTAVPIELAEVMDYARTGPNALSSDPEVWPQFEEILKPTQCEGKLVKLERHAFYHAAASPDTCLTIATGEQRIYANLLLTIGVVK